MSMKPIMERMREHAQHGDAESCAEPTHARLRLVEGLRAEVSMGKHGLLIDEPLDFGGTDRAPNPAEIALAGLSASIAVTCRAYADYLDIPVEAISIEASGNLDHRGFFDTDPEVRSGFEEIKVRMQIESSASTEELDRLMRRVDRCCPVLDMVRHATAVSVEVRPSQGPSAPAKP